jgi:hypothetical protein
VGRFRSGGVAGLIASWLLARVALDVWIDGFIGFRRDLDHTHLFSAAPRALCCGQSTESLPVG